MVTRCDQLRRLQYPRFLAQTNASPAIMRHTNILSESAGEEEWILPLAILENRRQRSANIFPGTGCREPLTRQAVSVHSVRNCAAPQRKAPTPAQSSAILRLRACFRRLRCTGSATGCCRPPYSVHVSVLPVNWRRCFRLPKGFIICDCEGNSARSIFIHLCSLPTFQLHVYFWKFLQTGLPFVFCTALLLRRSPRLKLAETALFENCAKTT